MCILLGKPSSKLSGYVKQYWFIDSIVSKEASYLQRVVPTGLPELLFFSGSTPGVADKGVDLEVNTVISGQHHTFYDFQINNSFSLFAITFQPHSLRMFFDMPGTEFLNTKIPLKFIFKDIADELEDKIASLTDFSEKIQIVESVLVDFLIRRTQSYNFKRIDYCVNTILKSKGKITVDHMASNAFLSRKQFERNFSDFVGTSPKQYLRIVRFQNAIHQMSVNPHLSLTHLACDCGFYDQAHMINEFKKLSGLTPRVFFSGCEPVSDLFAE